jgi:hypothetical protein
MNTSQNANNSTKAKFEFYIHLATYIVVISGLALLNYYGDNEVMWVKWPAFGWGIGVFFHALRVFVYPKYMD